jgi:hypothetical protein
MDSTGKHLTKTGINVFSVKKGCGMVKGKVKGKGRGRMGIRTENRRLNMTKVQCMDGWVEMP